MFKLQQSIQEEEILNNKVQIQQEIKAVKHQQFDCNICFVIAIQPVVSKCGHLFWYIYQQLSWSCIYNKKKCKICFRSFEDNQFIPIYTSHQQQTIKINRRDLPQKPKARNQQKIRNSSSGFSSHIPYNMDLQDNIQRQIPLSGYGYFPPTVIGIFNNLNESQQNDQTQSEQNIKSSTGTIQIILIVIVCFLIIMS